MNLRIWFDENSGDKISELIINQIVKQILEVIFYLNSIDIMVFNLMPEHVFIKFEEGC